MRQHPRGKSQPLSLWSLQKCQQNVSVPSCHHGQHTPGCHLNHLRRRKPPEAVVAHDIRFQHFILVEGHGKWFWDSSIGKVRSPACDLCAAPLAQQGAPTSPALDCIGPQNPEAEKQVLEVLEVLSLCSLVADTV